MLGNGRADQSLYFSLMARTQTTTHCRCSVFFSLWVTALAMYDAGLESVSVQNSFTAALL